jgi:plasmid stabilization system protein ParE
VATVVYSRRALDHIERAFQCLRDKNPDAAQSAVTAIQSAIDNLAAHPLVGRRLEGELRELIVSEVRILAIRHQREVGYQP